MDRPISSSGLNNSNSSFEELRLESRDIQFATFVSALVWILVPGCGFFYSGLANKKNALSMVQLCLWVSSIVTIQWFMFGYSLTFSKTSSSRFIGNFDHAFLFGVGVFETDFDINSSTSLSMRHNKIKQSTFCLYQGVTASVPSVFVVGAMAEGGKAVPFLIFTFLWTTLVYNPCAYWCLNPNGWAYQLGNFGGGSAVYISAGAAAVAYSYMLGPRHAKNTKDNQDKNLKKPHSMLNVMLGTVLIWFGSFGYNSGSALTGSLQAVSSCLITNLCGSVAAVTWVILDCIAEKKCKFGPVGFCSGAVVGLSVITSPAGFVSPWASVTIGIIGSVVCRTVKHILKRRITSFTDSLDVLAVHGFSGIGGLILSGIFANQSGNFDGGAIAGNWTPLMNHLIIIFAIFLWSLVASISILYVIQQFFELQLILPKVPKHWPRNPMKNVETVGMDLLEFGLPCYAHLMK